MVLGKAYKENSIIIMLLYFFLLIVSSATVVFIFIHLDRLVLKISLIVILGLFILLLTYFPYVVYRNKKIPDDVIEVKIADKGDAYLWYNKDSKKTSMFIGYSNKSSEDLINNEMLKYKNLSEENNNEENQSI